MLKPAASSLAVSASNCVGDQGAALALDLCEQRHEILVGRENGCRVGLGVVEAHDHEVLAVPVGILSC